MAGELGLVIFSSIANESENTNWLTASSICKSCKTSEDKTRLTERRRKRPCVDSNKTKRIKFVKTIRYKLSFCLTHCLFVIYILALTVIANAKPFEPSTGSVATTRELKQLKHSSLDCPSSQSTNILQAKQNKTSNKIETLTNLLCEDADDYPGQDIRKVLEKTVAELRDVFDTSKMFIETANNTTKQHQNQQTELSERRANGGSAANANSDDFDDGSSVDGAEQRVCPSLSRIVMPQKAKNKDNEWMFVVNEADFMQAVRIEICQSSGSPCNYLDDNLPTGMTSECKQKFAFKKMLAMHPLEKRMLGDLFRFPSCCACYVRGSYELRNFLATAIQTTTTPIPLVAPINDNVSNQTLSSITQINSDATNQTRRSSAKAAGRRVQKSQQIDQQQQQNVSLVQFAD